MGIKVTRKVYLTPSPKPNNKVEKIYKTTHYLLDFTFNLETPKKKDCKQIFALLDFSVHSRKQTQ